jgi:predicted acylesterase/phospholipase RssA/CRP-like cAMP-binding protein
VRLADNGAFSILAKNEFDKKVHDVCIMPNNTEDRIQSIIERYFGFVDEDAESLLRELQTISIAGGDWLMHQGDQADALYFLVRGRLQVWIEPDADQSDGEPSLLGEIAPGESVGEIGLLTGGRRTAGVRAIRDSLLMKLDRDAFEDFAKSHPALVIQLAGGIARRLTERTSRAPAAARNLVTIGLLPLNDSPWLDDFCDSLQKELARCGPTLYLTASNLGKHGAPVTSLKDDEQIPDTVKNWLDVKESQHRFLIYRGDAAATAWSQLCVRQSDLLLLLADESNDPTLRSWERELLVSGGAPVARCGLLLRHPVSDAPITGTARWFVDRSIDFHLHLREQNEQDVARVARVLTGNAVGLVLGGGAARGFAEIGAYKALCEAGIPVDWVGGASIGGIIGASIAFDRGPAEIYETGRDAFVKGKPFGDFTLPVMSVLRGKRMQRLTRLHLDGNIEDFPIPYFCVSSMLDQGTIHVHERGPIWNAVHATAALPGLLPPVVVDGRLAVDGGVLNNLPVDIMRQKPVGHVIAVDVSSRRTYQVEYDEMPSPWAVLLGRLVPFTRKYRVPGLVSVLMKSTEIGTLANVREQGGQADLLLRPPVSKFSLTDVRNYDSIVAVGYEHTREKLRDWAGPNENPRPRS